MKASSVHVGEEYAWVYGGFRRTPNNNYPMNATRIVVTRVYETVPLFAERSRTLCEARVVETGMMRYEIPVRHLIDYWNDYELERRAIKDAEDSKQRAMWERQAKEEERKKEILDALAEETELPRDTMKISVSGEYINMRREAVENWLIERGSIQQIQDTSDVTPSGVIRWSDV